MQSQALLCFFPHPTLYVNHLSSALSPWTAMPLNFCFNFLLSVLKIIKHIECYRVSCFASRLSIFQLALISQRAAKTFLHGPPDFLRDSKSSGTSRAPVWHVGYYNPGVVYPERSQKQHLGKVCFSQAVPLQQSASLPTSTAQRRSVAPSWFLQEPLRS